MVALTFVTGCGDATGFMALGGAFSSVMTGNMVLLGLSAGAHDVTLAVNSGSAIISYIVGVLIGARVAGVHQPGDGVWPRTVSRALSIELGVLLVFLGIWEASRNDPSTDVKLIMLVVLAAALGIQSSAVQRFGVPGLSSTYLTGTLTTLIAGAAARHPRRSLLPSFQILLTLVIGAAVGTIVIKNLPWLSPVLLVLPVTAVLATARTFHTLGGSGRPRC